MSCAGPALPLRSAPVRRGRWRGLNLVLALLTLGVSAAEEPPIIARAREFLGGEEVLSRVRSLRFIGTVNSFSGSAPPVSLVLTYQHPFQQRLVSTSPAGVEVTGLDGEVGWRRIHEPRDLRKWRDETLDAVQVARLRAATFESLAFFRGIESVGGRLEYTGSARVSGVACERVVFHHGDNVRFVRYFETQSGRLVKTETEDGTSVVEEGEQRVAGIRFPQRLVTSGRGADKSPSRFIVEFTQVQVNENFPAAQFARPASAPAASAPAPATPAKR
jgi:hypothetical protein